MEVVNMKKLFVLAVAMLMAGSAFAAAGATRYTGIASFVNSGVAEFTFQLKNVSDNGTATQIEWTNTAAFNTTGTDKWVRADQYAQVRAHITKAGVDVYMYQTNTANDSAYKATTPRTNKDNSTVYSGLVRQGSGGGEHRGYVPVAYSYVPQINTSITYDINTATTTATRSDRFWVDQADSNQSAGIKSDYTKIAGLVGPVFGQGTYGDWTGEGLTDHTAYMYFFGNFHDIVGGDIFGTDQLVIEQVGQ